MRSTKRMMSLSGGRRGAHRPSFCSPNFTLLNFCLFSILLGHIICCLQLTALLQCAALLAYTDDHHATLDRKWNAQKLRHTQVCIGNLSDAMRQNDGLLGHHATCYILRVYTLPSLQLRMLQHGLRLQTAGARDAACSQGMNTMLQLLANRLLTIDAACSDTRPD